MGVAFASVSSVLRLLLFIVSILALSLEWVWAGPNRDGDLALRLAPLLAAPLVPHPPVDLRSPPGHSLKAVGRMRHSEEGF